MKNVKMNMKNDRALFKRVVFLCLFFAIATNVFSQISPRVSSEVDTTYIKIGEQIKFKVIVEADSTAQVIFPEGQTFSPLETVEAFATDTTRTNDRLTLAKTYALTQFDSGSYKLPTQRIEINGQGFFTDSLQINVATVIVDTLAQKMFDIKPLIEVEKSYSDWWKWLSVIVIVLLIIGGLLYVFVLRKKPLTEEEKVALLPPYDRALMELKKLENSKYLIQDEYKQYYSELTDIVRSYLEEDVHVTALESTTDQLIDKLELMTDAGVLELDKETILQFKRILQTADLVKFAKSKPETSVAEQDRKSIEQIVIKTHDALPEPTEEELMQQAEYQEEQERKKEKKKWIVAAASLAGVLLLSAAAAIGYYGWKYSKDTVLGHPSKELLESEWVSSSYGYPPIILETPEVLKRKNEKIPVAVKDAIKEIQAFEYRSTSGFFNVTVSSITMTELEEPKFDQTVDQMIKGFEKMGAKNIITKEEEFVTISGVKGAKVFGSGKFPVPDSNELLRGKYNMILFGGKGFQQNITITWLDGDTYAEEIVDKMLTTLEVKTEI
jgi:hypothetical protein